MPEKSDIRAARTLGLAGFGLLAHAETVVKSIPDLGLATAVTASMAHWLDYRATRRASAAAIAAAVYAQIIAVTLLGIVWSGNWPERVAGSGIHIERCCRAGGSGPGIDSESTSMRAITGH